MSCNFGELSKDGRDSLAREKKGKRKAERDTENLFGEYSWIVTDGLPPVLFEREGV